jgi:hypothetical protein
MERRFGDRAGRALRLLQGVALGRGRPDAVAVIRTAIAFSEMRGPT